MILVLPGVGRHSYVALARHSLCPIRWPGLSTERWLGCQSRITPVQCRGARSLADDLTTGQGVVLLRAASILRFVETYPLIGRFVVAPIRDGPRQGLARARAHTYRCTHCCTPTARLVAAQPVCENVGGDVVQGKLTVSSACLPGDRCAVLR